MSTSIVSRFAPSPTGYLHVGGARTALFSWLLARHEGAGGKFLLRIEDTDLARSTQQACDQLIEDLQWLGLHWDNAANLVHQSKRLDLYNKIIDGLISRGMAYRAYETPEELDVLRKRAQVEKRDYIYRRPTLNPERQAQLERENTPHVVRFAMPVKDYSFYDVVLQKDVTVAANQIQDFVIRKRDGMPTYHFAVVVDDADMQVTHILRGQEHLLNTINHIGLQEALGYARPVYGHLPIIMNPDSTKMGKRDRDKKIRAKAQEFLKHNRQTSTDLAAAAKLPYLRINDWLTDSSTQLDLSDQKAIMSVTGMKESDLPEIMIHDFRKNGYLPEALLNFLSLLGWNPGGDREFMTMEDLTQLFTVEGIGKSNAKFDRAKLLSFNTEHCAKATPARLLAAFRDYLSVNTDSPLTAATDAQLATLLEMKKGFRTLREVDEISRFLFTADADLPYDPAAIDKVLLKNDRQGLASLQAIRPILEGADAFTAGALEPLIQGYADNQQLPLGKVAQPLRVALSGTTVSPTIFAVLEFLGKSRALARIDRCLAHIPPVS
ncbi:MAG TPA: glutamate--tRNA ligase [Tepidisphaeraceae bacterium]|jgi:glutamyl-tRNA synthetase|nr:glutamate--tRNA ligase [Tepidisphaeraceae bacterium]